jgi:LPS sulfotransferase NodH
MDRIYIKRLAFKSSNRHLTSEPNHTGMSNIDYGGHNLIFIVGSPRSGTTWLQRLLASHSKIRTGQESKLFRWYIGPQLQMWRMETERELDPRTATGRGGTGLSCYFQEEQFFRILKNYTIQLLEPMIGDLKPGELFVEKTPSHALCVTQIKNLLPESRIIHVLRDPRDVVASLLAASRTWGAAWAPRRPGAAAATWVEYVRAVRDATKDLSEAEFHQITYEQLWESPEKTLRQIVHFLGLEWSDKEIGEAVDRNRFSQAGAGDGTPIPIYGEVARRIGPVVKEPKDFVRKAQPGGWRTDLSIWEKFRVWQVARRTMSEMGYSWN